MKTKYVDQLGGAIYEGDIILYATTGCRISCFKVLGETKEKLKVTRGISPYNGKPMISHLNHPEDCVIISNQRDAQDVFKKMNKQ